MKWDMSSITQLITAGLAVFFQVWGAIHGQPYEPSHTAIAAGLAASSVGHAIHNNVVGGGK